MIGNRAATLFTTFARAGASSLLLAMPLVALDLLNNPAAVRRLPDLGALFGVLWVLATACVMIAASLVQTARSGPGILQRPAMLFLRVVTLLILALAWTAILRDQLPCFVGVPGCD